MMRSICLGIAFCASALLAGCSVFGGLSEQQQKDLDQHRAGAVRFLNARQYEKAIVQAKKGLAIDPYDYRLLGPLAWSYLQLSMRATPENEKYLKLAEVAFGDLIEMRSIEDHVPQNVFGYAIAQHNWARIEEERARQWRREAAKEPRESEKRTMIAAAEEHERKAQRQDMAASKYFVYVAEGSFAAAANRRDAFKYLMAIEYRYGHHKQAIAYGKRALEVNAEETAHWDQQYKLTKFPERERIIRAELANLKEDELKVRARLSAYHRELAEQPGNPNPKLDFEAAIVHLDVILGARPNSSEDYYIRGRCHRAVGHHDAARKDFQLFLRLGNLSKEHAAVRDAQEYLYGRGK